jgi:hypothetical protein
MISINRQQQRAAHTDLWACISSFKLLDHASSLVSWGFWLFGPYSDVIPCHGGLQPPFRREMQLSRSFVGHLSRMRIIEM